MTLQTNTHLRLLLIFTLFASLASAPAKGSPPLIRKKILPTPIFNVSYKAHFLSPPEQQPYKVPIPITDSTAYFIDGILASPNSIRDFDSGLMDSVVVAGRGDSILWARHMGRLDKTSQDKFNRIMLIARKKPIRTAEVPKDHDMAQRFEKWIYLSIKYPMIALENGIQGRVVVSFTIDGDGQIVGVKMLQTPDRIIHNEVERVLKNAPKLPFKKPDGTPSEVGYILTIDFILSH